MINAPDAVAESALTHVDIVKGYAVIEIPVLSAYLLVPLNEKTVCPVISTVHNPHTQLKLFALVVLSRIVVPFIHPSSFTFKFAPVVVSSKRIDACTDRTQ
jgi:hypothetical protein